MVRIESHGDRGGNKTETSLAHENLIEMNPGLYRAREPTSPRGSRLKAGREKEWEDSFL